MNNDRPPGSGESKNILEIYTKVSNSKTFAERASQGNSAIVMDAGDGWVGKRDKPGIDLVAREFHILAALQELDCNICPEIDLDYGCPGEFMIRKINNGGTLEEYILEFLFNDLDRNLLVDLLKMIAFKLNTFWDNGYIHGDLHLNNIVIGIERGGKAWDPYLIDFGYSFHQDYPLNFWELQTVIKDQSEDKAWFLHCLSTIAKEDDNLLGIINEFEDDLVT